jgi:hypothetical protein
MLFIAGGLFLALVAADLLDLSVRKTSVAPRSAWETSGKEKA